MPTYPISLNKIAQATKSDATLRDITEFIIRGWPETDDGLPEDLQLHCSLRDELAYHASCVVKGNRIIVSEALTETILQKLYRANLGMSEMKALAQERVNWPKMHRSIESFVLWCKACQEVGPRCNLLNLYNHTLSLGQPGSS